MLKNRTLTLVIAFILAVIAVMLVNAEIRKSRIIKPEEDKVKMVVTTHAKGVDEPLAKSDLTLKEVPVSAVPPQGIREHQMDMIIGQKLKNRLPENAYIMFGDVDFNRSFNDIVSKQKWAISVSLNGGAINRRLRPNDQIAIIGTLDVADEKNDNPVVNTPSRQTAPKKRKVTTVILPNVKILALDSNRQQGGDEFILELPPQEAQVLLAAQARGIELSPALRNRNDDNSNLDRKETKLVDDKTFDSLVQDVESVIVPRNFTKLVEKAEEEK